MPSHLVRWTALVAIATGAACAGDDAQFNVKYAPDYAKGGTVSVLGIFKDGRMSPETWDQLGPLLLTKQKCETAYNVDLVALSPTLSSAIDDYARANGITDALLDQLAPVARGDAIMVITVAGHPPQKIAREGGAPRASPQPVMRGGGRGRGRVPYGSSGSTSTTDGSVFEVSASLFSIRLHRSIALVSMTYSGRDVEAALAKFAAKLSASLPEISCVGWNWDVHVDEEKIRTLPEE